MDALTGRTRESGDRESLLFVADIVANTDGSLGLSPRRRVTAGDGTSRHEEGAPVFSPDGRSLLFLSDAENKGQLQAYVASPLEGKPQRLTNLTGALSSPRFLGDGSSVALLFIENMKGPAGPLAAHPRDAGEVGANPHVQRIAVVDLATKAVRFASPEGLFVYEFDASCDGKTFVATGAYGEGDANWWIARLYLLNAATGAVRVLYEPALQIAHPVLSPDGSSVAFVSGIMSDQGQNGGDVFVVPTAKAPAGEPGHEIARNLTRNRRASAAWLAWPSPDRILVVEARDGGAGVAAIEPSSGGIQSLWTSDATITRGGGLSLALARDGETSAVVRSSFRQAAEIALGKIGAWKPVTNDNAAFSPLWGEARSLHWQSGGRRPETVQGWLLAPSNLGETTDGPVKGRPNSSGPRPRKAPLVVVVHGGPASAALASWPNRFAATLASHGCYVLLPNPRGSFGAGEAFTLGNVKDFGYGDFDDILAGLDAAIAAAPIDPERIGIAGWSYGGYMTMWAVTRTTRFKAAVAGAGIANWESYYGQNRIDQWMLPYFGASVYDDPWIYNRSSPIRFIKNVKTPTLVVSGERDSEVPAAQAYEFWHALKTLGVPTQLVIYPDEGHQLAKEEHKLDFIKRLAEWFGRYLR